MFGMRVVKREYSAPKKELSSKRQRERESYLIKCSVVALLKINH